MKCPLFRVVRVRDHVKHGLLLEGRHGAGDMERAMKIQEVILRAMAKKITWWQAAEILGFSDRHLRRIGEPYGEVGYESLFDKRRGQASPSVPYATVEKVLALYREKYFDFNVQGMETRRDRFVAERGRDATTPRSDLQEDARGNRPQL